jgi:hypothetical protein
LGWREELASDRIRVLVYAANRDPYRLANQYALASTPRPDPDRCFLEAAATVDLA